MKPVARIIFSIAIALIISQVFYWLLKEQLSRHEIHNTKKLTELFLNNTDYDMLFIGSSKTHADINPGIIDTICQLNSYNAGIDGIGLFEMNMIFKAYLENHPSPKYLILSFDLHSFNADKKFFNYTQYIPFIKNEVIDKSLNDNGHSTLKYKLFPFLTLTDYSDDQKLVTAIKNIQKISDVPAGDFEYKGFLSNSDKLVGKEDHEIQKQPLIKTGLDLLKEVIVISRKKNIWLVLIYPPEYKNGYVQVTPNANTIFDTISALSSKEHIPFLRNDRLAMCSDSLLFRNVGHLNKKGAKVYSTILADQLNGLIVKQSIRN